MAEWLVGWISDLAVWIRTPVVVNVLCSWAKTFLLQYFSLHKSFHEYLRTVEAFTLNDFSKFMHQKAQLLPANILQLFEKIINRPCICFWFSVPKGWLCSPSNCAFHWNNLQTCCGKFSFDSQAWLFRTSLTCVQDKTQDQTFYFRQALSWFW